MWPFFITLRLNCKALLCSYKLLSLAIFVVLSLPLAYQQSLLRNADFTISRWKPYLHTFWILHSPYPPSHARWLCMSNLQCHCSFCLIPCARACPQRHMGLGPSVSSTDNRHAYTLCRNNFWNNRWKNQCIPIPALCRWRATVGQFN